MRHRWTLLLMFVVLAMVTTAPCQAQAMTLEGTWLVKVLFEGVFTIQYLQTFTQDGKTTLYLPTFGPVNEGDPRVACTGEWRRTAGGKFDVTMYCLYSQEWEGTLARIRGKLTLDRGAPNQ